MVQDNICWNCKKDISVNETPCSQCKSRSDYLKNPRSIEDKEKLNWLEKIALKRTLKKARKQFGKVRKNFQEGLLSKDDIIEKLMQLTEVLDIHDEIDGELVPISVEHLEKKNEEDLLDDLEEALAEAYKLI